MHVDAGEMYKSLVIFVIDAVIWFIPFAVIDSTVTDDVFDKKRKESCV